MMGSNEGRRGKISMHRLISKKLMQFVCVVLIVVSIIAVGFISYQMGSQAKVSSRTVDFGLKNLGKLVTQAGFFTNVQVIEDDRELFGLSIPFTQSKYIYSYDGQIQAGIDFEKIIFNPDEPNKRLIIELPEVEIISNTVDEQSFKVYDESKSIFTPLNLSKVNESRLSLEKEVEEKAISNGLLTNARVNAEVLIKGFLAGILELEGYTVEFKWPSDTSGVQ